MSRVDRPQLQWKRPPEWDRFQARVEEEFGDTTPYSGFVLEQAWREYKDRHPAEAHVDRLRRAVASSVDLPREKNLTRPASGEESGRVWVRVSEEVKAEMEQRATETGVQNHEILRAVVCWYLDGGLLGLLTRNLSRTVPEATRLVADLSDEEETSLGAKERRTVDLARRVAGDGGEFTRDCVREALLEVSGLSDSDYCMNEYLPRILDRLDYRRHPNNPDVFVPETRAREIADDPTDLEGPAIDRRPYADLTDEERVHGLRLEAVRRTAGRSNGRLALPVETVREEVFDGGPSKRKAKALMDKAAESDGFSTDSRGGRKRLKVDLGSVDRDILSEAGLDDGSRSPSDANPRGNVHGNGSSNGADPTEVEARLEDLMAATEARSSTPAE